MQLHVAVGAAVADHRDSVIEVEGFGHRRQYHAASSDAEHRQGLYLPGAKQHLEVGARKRAHTVLGDNNVFRFGSESRMNCAGGSKKKLLVLRVRLKGGKERITAAHFRQSGPETN